ncbi:hypothetical protein QLS31_01610 [Flavobacterium sp. XS2P24]|uniref:hypothetical protein n=1 Tax=Flavobacterium sp. XS2P24 TaxID=3041249 RepID=UPI0024A916A1|nr:hypothetical protein [Flavobacterium sp. XS2P24]MDI6048520.1 hypothetical protein [Flavobacterium sp. XS2P24]
MGTKSGDFAQHPVSNNIFFRTLRRAGLADSSLTDKELLNQFKAIEKMQENDKSVIKILIDAFITKKKIQQLAQ